ncbi:MAG TPA: ABC transporter permease [Acidimicrobiales bacterium]|nr:ABC transporter permease [Acidimicrobiales bacterium]
MSELVSYLILGLSRGLIIGVLALGLVLIYKGTRVLNLAQPFFGLLGAFLCWWFTARAGFLPFAAMSRPRFVVAALLSLVLLGLNGWSLERSLFRKLRRAPRLVTLVATIAIAQSTLGLVTLLFNRNAEQAEQIRVIPTLLRMNFVVGDLGVTGGDIQAFILIPLVTIAAAVFFRVTRFGVAVRAAAENGDSARLLGISVDRVATFTWVAGSVLAGMAGILLSAQQGGLNTTTLSVGFLVRALAAALIGGLTSLPGALAGGLIVGVAESVIGGYFPSTIGLPETVFFAAVIVVLVFRPNGLFGQREETEDKVAFVPALRELPARLRLSPFEPVLRHGSLVTVLVFAIAVSLATGSRTNGILVNVVVYAMVAVSLTVLMGYTGVISLGHWALVGVGSFATANLFTKYNVPFLLTVPVVVVTGMWVSVLLGLPALRIKGLYLAIVTLAFGYAAELYLFKSDQLAQGQTGISIAPPKLGPVDLDDPSNRPLFLTGIVLLLGCIWVARNLARSATGRSFFAVRENEKAAATLGVGLTQAKLVAFAISGGIAALAGVVHSLSIGNVNSVEYPAFTSIILVSMVMIGGLGSLLGPILGSFLVFGLPLLIELDNPWIVPLATGALLLIVVVEAPGGAAGIVAAARRSTLKTLVDISET